MSHAVLNSESAEPLYRQLEKLLREDIETGILSAGSKLPTENELVSMYSVSRVTVRKALDELSQQGYLERRSGKGTYVAEKKLQRALDGVTSFTTICREMGCIPGGKTVRRSIELASEKEARQLGVPEDSQILSMERVRYADGQPVVLELTKFTEDFLFLMNEDLTDRSLYELLNEKRGIRFTKSIKTVDIVYANSQEAKFLGVAKGYPLLRIESVPEDATGTKRHLSKQLCIGDKFKLKV